MATPKETTEKQGKLDGHGKKHMKTWGELTSKGRNGRENLVGKINGEAFVECRGGTFCLRNGHCRERRERINRKKKKPKQNGGCTRPDH